MKDDINSLSHSKWNCKYHIVFAQGNFIKYYNFVIFYEITLALYKKHLTYKQMFDKIN